MGKSQAGTPQLSIYSGCNCAVITSHNVETTPFGVLTPKTAIIVIGPNVMHSWNERVGSPHRQRPGIFPLTDWQIIFDVYYLETQADNDNRDAWIITLIIRATKKKRKKKHWFLKTFVILSSSGNISSESVCGGRAVKYSWEPCLFICGDGSVCVVWARAPTTGGCGREREKERAALIWWRWLREIWEITCVSRSWSDVGQREVGAGSRLDLAVGDD